MMGAATQVDWPITWAMAEPTMKASAATTRTMVVR